MYPAFAEVTQFGSYFVARLPWLCLLTAARARTPLPQIKLSHHPAFGLIASRDKET